MLNLAIREKNRALVWPALSSSVPSPAAAQILLLAWHCANDLQSAADAPSSGLIEFAVIHILINKWFLENVNCAQNSMSPKTAENQHIKHLLHSLHWLPIMMKISTELLCTKHKLWSLLGLPWNSPLLLVLWCGLVVGSNLIIIWLLIFVYLYALCILMSHVSLWFVYLYASCISMHYVSLASCISMPYPDLSVQLTVISDALVLRRDNALIPCIFRSGRYIIIQIRLDSVLRATLRGNELYDRTIA